MKKRQVVVIVVTLFTLLSIACGAANDAVQKQLYSETPTPPSVWVTRLDGLERTEYFWIKDGARKSRHSYSGMQPLLLQQADGPLECLVTRETIGPAYDLSCEPGGDAGYSFVVEEEGLLLGR